MKRLRLFMWLAGATVLALAAIYVLGTGGATVGKLISGSSATTRPGVSFVPHVGIVENNADIDYVVEELSSVENADIALVLNNVIATKDTIKVFCEVNFKTRSEVLADERPKVTLRANNLPIMEYSSRNGASGTDKFIKLGFIFKVDPRSIEPNTTYHLDYAQYQLSLDFKLKPVDVFQRPDQIGPTDAHNGISITAVSARKDGILTVDLYPVNRSRYHIESFGGGFGYLGQDLRLETSHGAKAFSTPRSYSPPNTQFMFDVSPEDRGLTLKIPFVQVRSDESKPITLPIPAEGRKIVVNQKVEFEASTMTIVDVERREGALHVSLKYDNKSARQIMQKADFVRRTFWGPVWPPNSGYEVEPDENGIYQGFKLELQKDDGDTLRLQVNPYYYLLDEYSFSLER